MKEQTLAFFKKALVDHFSKITEIPLIFIVNPTFPLTKPTFYRHREIVGIPNNVSFFIKTPKYRSKKSQIQNNEKPYNPQLSPPPPISSEYRRPVPSKFKEKLMGHFRGSKIKPTKYWLISC